MQLSHAVDRAVGYSSSSRPQLQPPSPHARSRRSSSRSHITRHQLRARAQQQSEASLDLDAPSTSASTQAQERFQLAENSAVSSGTNSLADLAATNPAGLATAAAALGLTTFGLVKLFNQGSRTYTGNVGQE